MEGERQEARRQERRLLDCFQARNDGGSGI